MRITSNLLLKKAKQKNDGTYPIYIRVTLDGQRIELSTGVTVPLESWDNSKQLVKRKHSNAKLLNNQLSNVKTKISDVYYHNTSLNF